MILSKIIKAVKAEQVAGRQDLEISSIAFDSRQVKPGALFVAVPGYKADGHAFIASAVKSGAIAVIAGKEAAVSASGVTFIRVNDPRSALAAVSAEFFDNPSGKLRMAGITGTSGKTTTTYLLRSIFRKNGDRTGLIGTIEYNLDGETFESKNTTPESLTLQELLNRMVTKGLDSCVMEVSSHSLALHRVDGIEFDAAVFLNLTQDHMDFHGTFEEYLAAKLKLFGLVQGEKTGPKVCAINSDDFRAAEFIKAAKAPVLTFGFNEGSDLRAVNVSNTQPGLKFDIARAGGLCPLNLKLKGYYNAYNAMAAAAVAAGLNIGWETIKAGLEAVENVPGRFETYKSPAGFTAVVDYAHKPDALQRLLEAVRGMGAKNIITVFGCGGERDRAKRPMMGGISARLSDFTVITSDNPRNENPAEIISEITGGMGKAKFSVVPDRKLAIFEAVKMAKEGDVVVVAGKGHEEYQLISGKVNHFSDKETVLEAISDGGKWKE